jgi:hypothetical protein
MILQFFLRVFLFVRDFQRKCSRTVSVFFYGRTLFYKQLSYETIREMILVVVLIAVASVVVVPAAASCCF